jgi:glycerophosphoryl diester phosphodiesterase
MSRPGTLVSDATVLDGDHIVVLERDNGQGLTAEWKRAFVIHMPGRDSNLDKRQVADLLDIRDPSLISLPARPGDLGLGDPFKFLYQAVEAVLPYGGRELAIVNDTNFGSMGRNPSLPDYSDFIVIRVPDLP